MDVDGPTHFSKLDPKTMKVFELRAELQARNLNTKGEITIIIAIILINNFTIILLF